MAKQSLLLSRNIVARILRDASLVQESQLRGLDYLWDGCMVDYMPRPWISQWSGVRLKEGSVRFLDAVMGG